MSAGMSANPSDYQFLGPNNSNVNSIGTSNTKVKGTSTTAQNTAQRSRGSTNAASSSTSDQSTAGTETSSQNTTGSGSSVTTTGNIFDTAAKTFLDNALGSTTYSKSAAIFDAQTAMDAAVQTSLKAGMPAISSAAKAAGGYNSSTQDMLNNDLSTRAAANGAQVVLNNIATYNKASNDSINAGTSAVGATKATTSSNINTSAGTVSGVNSTNSNTSSIGTNRSNTVELSDVINNTDTSVAGSSDTTLTNNLRQENRNNGALSDQFFPSSIGQGSGLSTVICTQMYMDGFLTRAEYIADNRYVRNNFKQATARGYRFWAVPFVKLMRKSPAVYAVGKFFGVRWSKHCAAYYLDSCEHNVTGWIMTTFVAPICFVIGSVVNDTEFDTLWEANRG